MQGMKGRVVLPVYQLIVVILLTSVLSFLIGLFVCQHVSSNPSVPADASKIEFTGTYNSNDIAWGSHREALTISLFSDGTGSFSLSYWGNPVNLRWEKTGSDTANLSIDGLDYSYPIQVVPGGIIFNSSLLSRVQ